MSHHLHCATFSFHTSHSLTSPFLLSHVNVNSIRLRGRLYTEASIQELDEYGIEEILSLATRFKVPLADAGFQQRSLLREWKAFKRHAAQSKVLGAMQHRAFYHRMRDQYSMQCNAGHFYNVLVIELAVDTIAVDTSECERKFFLMNFIMSAIRNRMGEATLRDLMRIHTMKEGWLADPSLIPVDEILKRWYAEKERKVTMPRRC